MTNNKEQSKKVIFKALDVAFKNGAFGFEEAMTISDHFRNLIEVEPIDNEKES